MVLRILNMQIMTLNKTYMVVETKSNIKMTTFEVHLVCVYFRGQFHYI
jgi:hypothetical protein